MTVDIQTSGPPQKIRIAIFERGFRPFFLLAAISALGLVTMWVSVFAGLHSFAGYYGSRLWHGHEMIFGYSVAVIAGFLLTAVQNWTGQALPKGRILGSLAGLWLLGRLLPFMASSIPAWSIAIVDFSFLPCLAVVICLPIVRTDNRRNLFFIPLMALFAGANLLVHLEVLGLLAGTAAIGEKLGLGTIITLIAIIGGRVIPFFTQSALADYQARNLGLLDWLCAVSLIAFVAVYSYPSSPGYLTGSIAVVAAALNLLRLGAWYTPRIWAVPLLWVLYIAYAWMIIGLVLVAVENAVALVGKPSLHALSIGTIGTMTLGMMARVSLGHSGRPLKPTKAIVLAFVAMIASAFVRVFLPLVSAEHYALAIKISGGLWVLCFLLFLVVFAPILVYSRIDLKPG